MNYIHKKIALVGATGNVGRKIMEILCDSKFPLENIFLYASKNSAGKPLSVRDKQHIHPVQALEDCDFSQIDIALFATENNVSKEYIPRALENHCRVIDSSSFYRLQEGIPLIVPPVNGDQIKQHDRLIAAANCLASPLSIVLSSLMSVAPIRRAVVTTFQSTSGAGKGSMDELEQQTHSYFNQQPLIPRYFPRQIAFNLFPQVGEILEDNFCTEEVKIVKETQKILNTPIPILATTTRVPVFIGHSIAIVVEFSENFSMQTIKEKLRSMPGIRLVDHHGSDYLTPVECQNQNDVFVGRLRRDPTVSHGLSLWTVSDNLRRGAALDTVEILQLMLNGSAEGSGQNPIG